jgi:hypothetical protein
MVYIKNFMKLSYKKKHWEITEPQQQFIDVVMKYPNSEMFEEINLMYGDIIIFFKGLSIDDLELRGLQQHLSDFKYHIGITAYNRDIRFGIKHII